MNDSRDEMQSVFSAVVSGTLGVNEEAALAERLIEDAELRRAYLEHLELHGLLAWELGEIAKPRRAQPVAEATIEPNRMRIGGYAALAAAVLIAGAAVTFFVLSGDTDSPVDTDQPDAPVATLIETKGGTLSTPDGTVNEGGYYAAGDYALDGGTAQFVLTNRVTVNLSGKTRLRMHHNKSVYLAHGKAGFNVPTGAEGFTVHLPDRSRIVDLGTAFDVEVLEDGRTEIEVTTGAIEVYGHGDPDTPVRLERGTFAVLTNEGRVQFMPTVRGAIHLGNLFDDDKFASLADALASDAMAATADDYDLGVYTVAQGADAVQEVAPDVWIDFRPLGWGFAGFGSVANDAWTGKRGSNGEAITGIRTLHKPDPLSEQRIEQGIGMHADAVIVFDLEELRRAGRLQGHSMRLRIDRAGLNDDVFGGGAKVHTVVAVTDSSGKPTAYVNGQAAELNKDGNDVWHFVKRDYAPLVSNGRYASLDIPVPAGAHHIALVVTGGGNGVGLDHAVFSGARLEIVPPESPDPRESPDQENSPGKDRAKD